MIKITLAIPTNRGLQPKLFQSALDMVAHSNQYEWHIICAEHGYTTAENRNYIAVQALNNKSDYLLTIDDDMTFEPDLLDKLIANEKDIVGVAYHTKVEGGKIIKFLDEVTSIEIEKSTDPKYKTTFECHATGTGIILIKCSVFLKIPRPWFAFEYFPTGQCSLGEDWYFCREAKKVGFKIFTDPRPVVGHLGEALF